MLHCIESSNEFVRWNSFGTVYVIHSSTCNNILMLDIVTEIKSPLTI